MGVSQGLAQQTGIPAFWGSRSTKSLRPVKSGGISRMEDGGSDAPGMEVCNMDGERTVDSRNIQRKTIAQAAVVLIAIFVGVCSVMGASGKDVSAKPAQRTIG